MNTRDQFVKQRLEQALHFTLNTRIIGATNKSKDVQRTNNWSTVLGFFSRRSYKKNNSKWTLGRQDQILVNFFPRKNSQNPFAIFNLSDPQKKLLIHALCALSFRAGNCSTVSSLAAKYLWEHPEGINRIEKVVPPDYDHTFLIINREGDINDSSTWGDAWILDPATADGLIYPASEFLERQKETKQFWENEEKFFLENKYKKFQLFVSEKEVHYKVDVEIKPKDNPYPTLSQKPFYPLEYYYYIDSFPLDEKNESIIKQLPQAVKEHKNKFKEVLNEIQFKKSNSCLR